MENMGGEFQENLKSNLGFATEVEFDRCRQVKSRNQSGQHQGSPGTIIFRFNKVKDKQQILNNVKKLRDTAIYIYENFSRIYEKDLRKTLWEKVLEYRGQNKFVCLYYRSIIVREFVSQYCTLIKGII